MPVQNGNGNGNGKDNDNQSYDTLCRLCGKIAESIPHILASCSALAHNKYLARHNAAL